MWRYSKTRMIFNCELFEINNMITASVNNTNIFRYIGTLSDGDNYSHNLVHIHTNEKPVNEIINGHTFVNSPYTSCELKFASTIVGNKVFARLKEFYKEETYKFVASVSLLGSVRGYVFEIIAHNELSAAYKKIGNTPDDIEDGKYCKPAAKNFETIDSIYIGKDYNFTFQMMVGRTHDIKQHGYELIHEKLGGELADHTIRHYFILLFVHSEEGRKRPIKKYSEC
ncbi:hypothetical protein GLOIN_2v1486671 [Rhizophagus irregularis DAOM 181602=DAOM 197198]|nr:hypothetical protein GLOIN_2v1486671 [Rhizophagus irregularis DAOM 181602=DAOM 197198]